MNEKKISSIMATSVVSVPPEISLSEAVSLMKEKHISCLAIIKEGIAEGIFTERDLVWVVNHGVKRNSPIKEFMTGNIITVEMDTGIYDAFDIFEQYKIRHLVVVGSDGHIAGVVSHSDIIRNLGVEHFVEIRKIGGIMTPEVFTTERGNTVFNAIDKMYGYSISCIVIEEDKRPVGILTERDVVGLFLDGKSLAEIRVDEVMNSPVKTVTADMPVHEAAIIMVKEGIRRLVVVDTEGHIAGLVTQYDFIKGIMKNKHMRFIEAIILKKERNSVEANKNIIHNRMLDAILNTLPFGVIAVTDQNHRVIKMNSAANRILGCGTGDVLTGDSSNHFVRQISEEISAMKKNLTNMNSVALEYEGGRIMLTVSVLRDAGGEILGYMLWESK